MSSEVWVAAITVSGSVVIAALSFLLNKSFERKADWHRRKLDHYNELLSAISGLAGDGSDRDEADRRFARAFNTVALVAPQRVIDALIAYHGHVAYSNPDRSIEKHDYLLTHLLLAIRDDLGVSKNDSPDTFSFHLVTSGSPEARRSKR